MQGEVGDKLPGGSSPEAGPEDGPTPRSKQSFANRAEPLGGQGDVICGSKSDGDKGSSTTEKAKKDAVTHQEKQLGATGPEHSLENEEESLEVLLRPGNDPYEFDLYRYILGIIIFVHSIYIIGIGVAMAIAPNVQTFLYASTPFVLEASVKVREAVLLSKRRYQHYSSRKSAKKDIERSLQRIRRNMSNPLLTQGTAPLQHTIVSYPRYESTTRYHTSPPRETYRDTSSFATFTPQTRQLAHY